MVFFDGASDDVLLLLAHMFTMASTLTMIVVAIYITPIITFVSVITITIIVIHKNILSFYCYFF